MTPDTDDPRDDWLTVDEKLSVHRDETDAVYGLVETAQRHADRANRLEAELAAIQKIVDGALTCCQLGEAIAEHFGRPIPDTDTEDTP